MKMVTKTRPKNGGEIVKDKANFNASVKMWASFYRANIHRFATDYLGLALFPFQMVLLFMMNINNNFFYTASRGQGKSFLVAVFCCCRAILYPNSKIIVGAGSRGF